ncbi:MAG TPA: carboxypeptidase regulatory-like domain-containing protein [Bryobacteraceae bacterium]|nr:carboxypeptidase regulatory-like domain-containing protein [Bryobacteraceae bacterium]
MKINIRFGLFFGAMGLGLFTLCAPQVFAQATASGTIQGTVFDQSQAVVIGAEVVITSKATGEKRTASTNNVGNYRFDLLSAGGYSIRVTQKGFAATVENVDLLVGQTATANFTLTPGATTEVVEVTGAAPLVDLGKTSVSTNITPTEVEDLPMVGRDVANLAYLAPGVKAADSYDPTKNRYAIMSVNGSGGRNVNVTVNGVDNKDNTVGGPVMQLPLEAVQEFQISTQRFSAENGRSEGAAINMITKQGTNDYHGSVFSYFRDTALDTDEKVPNGTGGFTSAHPAYTRQQFGGSAGGRLKRDKLFGFFAIERQREHQNLEETTSSYNELVLAKQAGFAAQPATSIPTPFFETRYNGRLDWTINSKNSAYVSYNSQANNSLNDQSNGTADLTNGNYTLNHLQLINATLNSLVSSTMVNTFTAGYQYWNNLIASNISAPLIVFPDASLGTNTNVPQQSWQRKWQFRDDVSKTIGAHTLKFGADLIHTPQQGGFFEFSSTLEIDFAADPSVILNDPVNYPQKFATPGAVTGMTVANGDPYFLVSTNQLGLYFQDDWKVSKRLMLNLGMRWDKDYNFIGLSDVKDSRTYQELVALNSPFSNPYVSRLPHDDNKDFSPRIGFAYDLTGQGQHVLRGGFGLYYGNVFQNIPLFMEQMSNPTVFQSAISLSAPTDVVTGTGIPLGNWRYGVDPMPVIPAPSSQLASGSVGRLMDPNYRNPVTEEFNIGYSYSPTRNSVFEAEYTHVLGLHENKTMNIDEKAVVNGVCCTRPLDPYFANSTQPELASVRDEQSIGRSHYDGFNLSFRQRMTHHISLNVNYTLARAYSFDAGGTSFRNYPRLESNPFASYEWGPDPNDERHHVTLSGIIDLPKGFQLAPIMQFGSPRPFNLTNSANTLNTGGGTTNAVVVPTNNPTNFLAYSGNNTAAQNCFYGINGVSQSCTIAAYDPLRGDPFFQLDMRLSKNIRFRERANLQLVAQAFNLTNRANYGNDFNGNIASPSTFDHPAGFLNPSSTVIPRSVWGELGLRFTF